MEESFELQGKADPGTCIHCNQKIIVPVTDEAGHSFCCNGCQTVFHILKENGLENYYSLKRASGAANSPVPEIREKYAYLQDPSFIKNYAHVDHEGNIQLRFFLEGVHCLACLWLIEKLPQLCPGVLDSRLNMGKSIVTVTLGRRLLLHRRLTNWHAWDIALIRLWKTRTLKSSAIRKTKVFSLRSESPRHAR